jgi:hypothetical protein
MKCVQCGRERKIGMARTDKFCTQRCIINWLEAHPEKSVDDAMGAVSSPEAPLLSIANVQSLSTSPAKKVTQKESGGGSGGEGKQKPVSRALKNLQIDMALPGTKLAPSNDDEESDEEGEGRSRKRPRVAAASQFQQTKLPGVGKRSTRRGAQISPAKPVKSATSTPVAAAKTGTGGTGKKSTQSPGQPGGSGVSGKVTAASVSVKSTPVATGGNIKRMLSASAPHPPALKKAKTGGGGTPSKPSSSSGAGPKAVTFNLGFVQSSQKGQPTPTFSLVPIDQLSAPLGGTLVNQQDSSVSVPDGK